MEEQEHKLDLTTEEGFEKLYALFWERVCALCLKYTGSMTLAQDMTQDIFQSVWERREKLTVEKSLERYLIRAAKYKVYEHHRKVGVRSAHLEELKNAQEVSVDNTDNEIAMDMLNQQVEGVLHTLPKIRQKIYTMSRVEGMDNREISEKLSVSERNVRHHLQLTLEKIRAKLKYIGAYLLF